MPERLPENRPMGGALPLLHIEVVTPQGLCLRDDVDEVVAPAARGEIGVLPLHRPLLAALVPGSLRWRHGTDWEEAAVSAGFLEVGADKVILLSERFVEPDAIDVPAAQAEHAEADKAILTFDGEPGGARLAELERDRAWAAARLDVASRRKLKI